MDSFRKNHYLVWSLLRGNEGVYINDLCKDVSNGVFLSKIINFPIDDKRFFKISMDVLSGEDDKKLKDNEKIVLSSYQKLFNELFLKCQSKSLSDDESKLFLFLLSDYIINNDFRYEKEAISYLNNYILNDKIFFNVDELVLLTWYSFDFIKKSFNKNVKFEFRDFMDDLASCNIIDEICVNFNKKFYFEIGKKKKLSEKYFYSIVVWITYAVLHEFYHALQMESFRNGTAVDMEKYEKEFTILKYNPKFYHENASNFIIEREAMDFGSNYTVALLNKCFPSKVLNDSFKKINKQIKRACLRSMDDRKFEILLNNEYMKINNNLNDSDSRMR